MEKYFTEIVIFLATTTVVSGFSSFIYVRVALATMKEQIGTIQKEMTANDKDIKTLEIENRQLITGVTRLEGKVDNLERMLGEMRGLIERVLTRDRV